VELDTGELFTVPPGEFVGLRERLAADARGAGDAERAKRIRALRRPTMSAWAVNLLAHKDPETLGALLEVGEQLRRAWAEGSGLGEPERRRSELIALLVRRATTLAGEAGHPLRETAAREIEETLSAATIDPDAAEQVRAGQLARTLSYTGFAAPGSIAVAAAATRPSGTASARTGAPAAPGKRVGEAKSRREAGAEEARMRLRRLTVEADNAAERAAEAARDQADWESELDQAQRELSSAEDRLEKIRAELKEREGERNTAERRVRLARREHDRATRSAATARRRADEARRRLDRESNHAT
jgi:hypothetical protein